MIEKLRNMQAMADYYNLISYNTPIAYKCGKWCVLWDYPSTTSKKHLRAWLDDYYGLPTVGCDLFCCYVRFRDSAHCALVTARRLKNKYIILKQQDSGVWTYATYSTREEMHADEYYYQLLQDITPTI